MRSPSDTEDAGVADPEHAAVLASLRSPDMEARLREARARREVVLAERAARRQETTTTSEGAMRDGTGPDEERTRRAAALAARLAAWEEEDRARERCPGDRASVPEAIAPKAPTRPAVAPDETNERAAPAPVEAEARATGADARVRNRIGLGRTAPMIRSGPGVGPPAIASGTAPRALRAGSPGGLPATAPILAVRRRPVPVRFVLGLAFGLAVGTAGTLGWQAVLPGPRAPSLAGPAIRAVAEAPALVPVTTVTAASATIRSGTDTVPASWSSPFPPAVRPDATAGPEGPITVPKAATTARTTAFL